ncbi:glucan endo-1,3-beta-glucosidase, acidic isoform precursor [Panicum miliaceum]|uniref:Glucan endo-1,3-beta-glucosidase, acidic isoform n=1 Tax=Panicum miliaceum TaxID=4540 RepID=A0A3L6T9Y7_PANMI|nr:glucan endo-1,3-beta-glucosidase, acidic isoform precursor [Panicum miliaceum]
MATRSALRLLCHVLLAVAVAAATGDDRGKIGICHGRVGGNLPAPQDAEALLRQNGVTKARLFLPDPAVLPAFAAAGARGRGAVAAVRVLAHAPAARVRYLAAGNEVLYGDRSYAPSLVPAMRNLHAPLAAMGLEGSVRVSSAHASSVLAAGAFDPAALPVLRPMLRFLADTGAPFMVNAYPFISYANDPDNVPLDYALFGAGAAPVRDGALAYTNLFDATVDALVAALEKEGFGGVPVAVTETGWPTAGHPAATPQNAAAYNAEGGRRAAWAR